LLSDGLGHIGHLLADGRRRRVGLVSHLAADLCGLVLDIADDILGLVAHSIDRILRLVGRSIKLTLGRTVGRGSIRIVGHGSPPLDYAKIEYAIWILSP